MRTLHLGSSLEVSTMTCKQEWAFGAVVFIGRGKVDLGLLFGPWELSVEAWLPVKKVTA